MGKLSNLTIAYFSDGLGKKPPNQDNISMALGFITVRAKDALIAATSAHRRSSASHLGENTACCDGKMDAIEPIV